MSDLISRADALAEFKDGRDVYDIMESIEELPSAEVEDRLYIKIYADDEPSVKAEKLYQICGETQNGEVAEWLKEYFPSEPDSRQRGEWVWKKDAMDWGIGAWVCNKCGCRPNTLWSTKRDSIPLAYAGSRFCGYCGAYMGGQNDD